MPFENYRKIEQALARQRREIEGRQSALDRAAHESCASLRILDVANVISDAIESSERNVIGHVRRMFVLRDVYRRREKEQALNFHRRLTQIESQLRLLAKANND
jgi:hypothetical protein